MANNNTAFIPEVWAPEGLALLRKRMVMGALVHRDFEDVPANAGDTINYDIPASYTANFRTVQDTTDLTRTAANRDRGALIIDKYRYVQIPFTDAEVALGVDRLMDRHLGAMVEALADAVESDLTNLFSLFSNNAGTFNTTLTEAAVLTARETLWDNEAPMGDGFTGVIHQHAENDLLQIARLTEDDKASGFGEALRSASLGTRYGISWFTSNHVPKSTNDISNCVFHRDAIGLVVRPLGSVATAGAVSREVMDGDFSLRITSGYDVRTGGTSVTADILYGCKILRDELGVELRN